MFKNVKNSKRDDYPVLLEKSTILALILVISIFFIYPRMKTRQPAQIKRIGSALTLEEIPVTHQGAARKPPPRPVIPIPSDDDLIPDDVTIDDTELTFESLAPGAGSGIAIEPITIFQPRPIYEVIPQYSEELQKKGIEGIVTLHLHIDPTGRVVDVIILENTTGSSICANAAREAALKGRYVPAKKDDKPTDLWITRSYTFGLQK